MNEDVKASRAVISRRRALGLGGTIGLGGLLAACGGGDNATGSASATPTVTATAGGSGTPTASATAGAGILALLDEAGTCTLAREATQGPYWFDVDYPQRPA